MHSSASRLVAHEEILKVVILHSLETWADGLERMLAPRLDIEVVTAHQTFSWIRHAVGAHGADVLLVQVCPPEDGFREELAALFEQAPDLGVVAMSESRDAALLGSAVRAGVRGWVEPTTSVDHLVQVLHGVAHGETWFPPALMTSVLDSLLDESDEREADDSALAMLSGRERTVLSCLVQGLSRQEIAEQLCVSPHTVRTHINNLLHKLDVHTTLAAVSIARRSGLAPAATSA
jgi:DNA-binding NarL/FixJ family response regulator